MKQKLTSLIVIILLKKMCFMFGFISIAILALHAQEQASFLIIFFFHDRVDQWSHARVSVIKAFKNIWSSL